MIPRGRCHEPGSIISWLSSTQKTKHKGAECLSPVTTTTEIRFQRQFMLGRTVCFVFQFCGDRSSKYIPKWPETPDPPCLSPQSTGVDYWRVPAVLTRFVLLLFFCKGRFWKCERGSQSRTLYLCLQYIPFPVATGHSAWALNPACYAAIC